MECIFFSSDLCSRFFLSRFCIGIFFISVINSFFSIIVIFLGCWRFSMVLSYLKLNIMEIIFDVWLSPCIPYRFIIFEASSCVHPAVGVLGHIFFEFNQKTNLFHYFIFIAISMFSNINSTRACCVFFSSTLIPNLEI